MTSLDVTVDQTQMKKIISELNDRPIKITQIEMQQEKETEKKILDTKQDPLDDTL